MQDFINKYGQQIRNQLSPMTKSCTITVGDKTVKADLRQSGKKANTWQLTWPEGQLCTIFI
jgi:hypothetical protein